MNLLEIHFRARDGFKKTNQKINQKQMKNE